MAELPASFSVAASSVSNGRPPAIPNSGDRAAMGKAAEEFEAFFISQVLEHMFAGIRTDGPFGGGHGEGIFRSLMLQEYGNVIAAQGGIGLSDALVRDMIRLQETA